MVEVVRRADLKRSERPSPISDRKPYAPLRKKPERPLISRLRARLKAWKKAMEDPNEALARTIAEPIDQEVLVRPYMGKPMKTH